MWGRHHRSHHHRRRRSHLRRHRRRIGRRFLIEEFHRPGSRFQSGAHRRSRRG